MPATIVRSKLTSSKFNFTLEPEISSAVKKIAKGKRSQWVNAVLKNFLKQKEKTEMIEGFKQKTDDFSSWESLGFETWN